MVDACMAVSSGSYHFFFTEFLESQKENSIECVCLLLRLCYNNSSGVRECDILGGAHLVPSLPSPEGPYPLLDGEVYPGVLTF